MKKMTPDGSHGGNRKFAIGGLGLSELSFFLVGGLEHFLFFHSVGNKLFHLTFIFFRGVGQPPTSFVCILSTIHLLFFLVGWCVHFLGESILRRDDHPRFFSCKSDLTKSKPWYTFCSP